MISVYDLEQYAKNKPDKCWFIIDENDFVIDKTTKEVRCHVDTLVEVLRKHMHCDFEAIHEIHGLLQVTLRCKECGTVIFASEDEAWEPKLCCPVCSDYKTGFKYWSGDDISKDKEKKEYIDFLIKDQKEWVKKCKRREKRGGKFDWEIAKCKIKLFKRAIFLNLECDDLFETKLKGLRLLVHWARKEGLGYIYTNNFYIPLSVSFLKRMIRSKKDDKNTTKTV